MTEPFEVDARQRKFAQILAAQEADTDRMAEVAKINAQRTELRPVALELLDDLARTGDVGAFRAGLDAWSRKPGYTGFGGFNGQMLVNQLVSEGVEATLLVRALRVPTDEEDAVARMRELLAFVESVKKGAHPAPKRAAFVCTFFWSLQQPENWPCAWASAETMLYKLGWYRAVGDLVEQYLEFRDVLARLDVDPELALHALFWFEEHRFTGLDPALVDRCGKARELRTRRTPADDAYVSADVEEAAEQQARAILGDLRLLGESLQDDVANAFGRTLRLVVPALTWTAGTYRADGWVSWRLLEGNPGAGIRVWATSDGVTIGLHPGWYHDGWYDEAAAELAGRVPPGMQFFAVRSQAEHLQPAGAAPPGGEFMLGTLLQGPSALGRQSIAGEIVAMTATLQPLFDRLVRRAGVSVRPTEELASSDPLASLVEEFRKARSYPNDKDRWHRSQRETMAAVLSPEELAIADIASVRSIYNGNRYGSPGPQSILNVTIRDANPVELERIFANLSYLLWGEGPDEERIDRLLDPEDLGVKGLGEAVIMKLLAIAHPDRYVPVYPYTGDMGKVRLMKLIGLTPPAESPSRGARQVQANDAIRNRLDGFFPNDPWGMGQFLYWRRGRAEVPPEPIADVLEQLAGELLVDRGFLETIVALLRDKGQVVFYGPPGTGKTYLARKLAEALAPEPTRRMIVQFHPSTSYEDFFEGYRPEGIEGTLTYRLTPGPLAQLAERAQATPGVDHVMVVDEINRANLPRVLGELLYLLEYRGERVQTLYRAEDGFELPPDLLFIGTMNTADRSIALIDAALRRRFHFVPFFPGEGAMGGLLGRWLADRGKTDSMWIADLVDSVNADLVKDLGGPHLQLGPSHFMRDDIDAPGVLDRIWEYDIFPFVEDQLFGEHDRIAQYRLPAVRHRFDQQVSAPDSLPLEGTSDGA